jgi:hypothetical protein
MSALVHEHDLPCAVLRSSPLLAVLKLAAKERVHTLDKARPRGRCGGRRASGHGLGVAQGRGKGGPAPPLHGHSSGQQRQRRSARPRGASTAPLEVRHAAGGRRDRAGSFEKGGELGQQSLVLSGHLLPRHAILHHHGGLERRRTHLAPRPLGSRLQRRPSSQAHRLPLSRRAPLSRAIGRRHAEQGRTPWCLSRGARRAAHAAHRQHRGQCTE